MRFPTYWTRVANEKNTVFAKGWSDSSFEEAKANAQARLERILACLRSSKKFDLDRYSYEVDHVICEEVVDRVFGDDGSECAVISRNGYGAVVMNAAQLMFIDIDFPELRKPKSLLSWLFGKPKEAPFDPETVIIDRVHQWQAIHPDVGLRIYRTFAGIRLIVTNRIFQANDPSSIEMMRELGCDELYITLCRSQNCFRARLSPKPWRIAVRSPKPFFPVVAEQGREDFSRWLTEYIRKSSEFKVCRFMQSIGNSDLLSQHQELISLHDRLCCNEKDLPLA